MAMTTQATYGAPAAKKMKLEHDGISTPTPSPAPSTPQPQLQANATTTTTTGYSTNAQWSTQAIPIDPALQSQPAPTPTPAQTQAQVQAQVQQIQRQAPIMNYQHYQAYGAPHYPQFTQHYAQYQPTQTATIPTASTPAQPTTSTTIGMPLSRQPTQAANEVESNVDISTLNDALGSAGLDLRAEEETLQRSQDYYNAYRSFEDRSRKQPSTPSFDARILGQTMRTISTRHKLARIPEDSVTYLALALRCRLQGLIEAMAGAATHRAEAQFDRPPSLYKDGTPMWSVVVRRDTKKQLEVLERVEREEEMRLRRERRERADAAAAAASAAHNTGSPSLDGTGGGSGADDAMDGSGGAGATGKKPKKKKEGPGVTAKNMSEDVQKRLSNATAAQAAGLGRGKYAWMNAGGAAGASAPTKPKPSTSTSSPATQSTPALTQVTQTTGTTTSSWTKPYVPASMKASASPAPGDEDKTVITIRDAMFVIERERGHGAGRGSARCWV